MKHGAPSRALSLRRLPDGDAAFGPIPACRWVGDLSSPAMSRIALTSTDTTPEVLFDPQQGSLRIAGCSIPENAEGFFRPLLNRLEQYVAQPAGHTSVLIALRYFNSSTSKYLLDLLKLLNEVHLSGTGTVELEWRYEQDDLDMEEAGQDYRALLEMPVRVVAASIP